jgi:hypothetical protein
MEKIMNKKEYLALKNVPIIQWTHQQCVEADRLIEKTAMTNLGKILKRRNIPKDIAEYVMMITGSKFGTGEVDEFLMNQKAYPDWQFKIKD